MMANRNPVQPMTGITEMPDLAMDKIFSFLPLKDRLNCRLVTPRWGLDLLSIRRIFKGCILRIGCKSEPPYNDVYHKGENIPLNFDMQPMNIQPIIDSSFFDSVEVLSISVREEVENFVPICLEHCRNATRSIFHGFTRRYVQGIITFIQNNQMHLKRLDIGLSVDQGDAFNLKSLVATCPSLRFLRLNLYNHNQISIEDEDLWNLPSSLVDLFMLSPLTNTQISSGIRYHLTNLRWVELYVKHSHDQYDPEELNLRTILDLLPTLPSLRYISFCFVPKNEWQLHLQIHEDQLCGKIRELESSLRDELDDHRWNIKVGLKRTKTLRESLTIVRKRV